DRHDPAAGAGRRAVHPLPAAAGRAQGARGGDPRGRRARATRVGAHRPDPAAGGGAVNDALVVSVLAAAVAAGTPLALAALGALLSERSGVLNLGVEGIRLVGAVTAFRVADGTGSAWSGLVAGILAGGALSALHAVLAISLRANQIVSGLALVILGTGVATFL